MEEPRQWCQLFCLPLEAFTRAKNKNLYQAGEAYIHGALHVGVVGRLRALQRGSIFTTERTWCRIFEALRGNSARKTLSLLSRLTFQHRELPNWMLLRRSGLSWLGRRRLGHQIERFLQNWTVPALQSAEHRAQHRARQSERPRQYAHCILLWRRKLCLWGKATHDVGASSGSLAARQT